MIGFRGCASGNARGWWNYRRERGVSPMEMQLNLIKKWKPDEWRTLDLDTSLPRYHTGQFDKVLHSLTFAEPSI